MVRVSSLRKKQRVLSLCVWMEQRVVGVSRSKNMETQSSPCEGWSLKKLHFFKVLMGDFQSSLKIPPAVLIHIAIKQSGTTTVKDRSGRCWEIELLKRGNGMIFSKGWEIFVEENELEIGDFLVFQYDGGLHFTVTIFGTTATEKNFCVGKSSENPIRHWVRDETHGRKRDRRWPVENRKRNRSTFKAWDSACSFRSSNPTFKKVVTDPSNYKLTIPSDYEGPGLPNSGCLVKLENCDGMQWSVRYVETRMRAKSGRRFIQRSLIAGWYKFYAENCLKQGDVSVFEFVENYRFLVHIFKDCGE